MHSFVENTNVTRDDVHLMALKGLFKANHEVYRMSRIDPLKNVNFNLNNKLLLFVHLLKM